MKLYKDAEWLRRKYVDERLSQYEISKICGVSRPTIGNWMTRFDIPIRGPRDISYKDSGWLHERYIDEGLLLREIGEICGVDLKTIREWMKKFGIPSRSRGGENNPNWKGGKVRRICEICDTIFLVDPYVVEKGCGRFCSTKCKGIWMSQNLVGENSSRWNGGKAECTCELCGTTRLVTPSVIKRGWGRFCSLKCQGIWQSQDMTGEDSPSWKGGTVERVCEVCGITFPIPPSAVKKGRGRFCSTKCYGVWLSQNRVGGNHPNWQGGLSFEPYPPTFNELFKRRIRERDNYTCAICKQAGKNVHHINYVKDDTYPRNCITLCRSCHTITNTNRGYWEKVLTQLMTARRVSACLPIHVSPILQKSMGEEQMQRCALGR